MRLYCKLKISSFENCYAEPNLRVLSKKDWGSIQRKHFRLNYFWKAYDEVILRKLPPKLRQNKLIERSLTLSANTTHLVRKLYTLFVKALYFSKNNIQWYRFTHYLKVWYNLPSLTYQQSIFFHLNPITSEARR